MSRRPALLVLLASLTLAPAASAQEIDRDPERVFERFTAFAAAEFSPATEPLFYETFGNELVLTDEGHWLHESRNSAAVGFETNLPASSRVEYGPTAEYGRSTEAAERNFFLHLHHLTGLEPDTQYHYRIVAEDERGERVVSEDRTFMTRPADEGTLLRAPEDGSAITISQPGHYVLVEDIVASQSAINVTHGDVTLDLNGHSIVYNAQPMSEFGIELPSNRPRDWWEQCPTGVKYDAPRRARGDGVRILNGRITQGAGGDGGSANQFGCAPVALQNGSTGEIAGVSLTWHGNQVGGIDYRYQAAGMHIHHNVLRDKGTEIVNRHQAVRAMRAGGTTHHNLVVRARQRGIEMRPGSEVYANEVYVDSWTTNSFALAGRGGDGMNVHGNRIFGGGYLAVGIHLGGTENVHFRDNFMLMQASEPERRWPEYGPQSGAHGLRLQWGGAGSVIEGNVIISRAREGGCARTLWVAPSPSITGAVFRDNVIKSIGQDSQTDDVAAISLTGDNDTVGDHGEIHFINNRIVANRNNVRAGETYGGGSSGTRFIGTTFVRAEPRRDDYRVVQIGFWNREIYDHQFIDSAFEGGASLEAFAFEGNRDARRSFSVGHSLSIEAAAGAKVTIHDHQGDEVFAGEVGEDGSLTVELLEYRQTPDGREALTPHRVVVEHGGGEFTVNVTMDGRQSLSVGE